MSIWFELAVLVCLTLLNGLFAGAEMALVSVRKTRLKELAEDGRPAARTALALREDPERFLATVQVGITVVGATAAAFGGSRLEEPVGQALAKIGAGRWADELSFVVIVGFVSALSIVVGELVPKSLALRASERFALLVARPIQALAWVARPIVWLLTGASNLILKPFHDQTTFIESRISPEELNEMVGEAAAAGGIDPKVSDMAARAITMAQLRVGAIMIPRTAVVTLNKSATSEEAWATLRDSPHSRYPVIDGSPDEVVGYVTARDLYSTLVSGAPLVVSKMLHPILFMPEQTLAVDALKQLQERRTQIAMIIDEQGGIAGLVTMEDIAEELLGDILTEHERPAADVVLEGDRAAVLRADLPIHDANRHLPIALPQGTAWTTVAGLILARAGRVPQPGDRVPIADGVEAEILESTVRQIRRVRLHLAPPAADRVSAAPSRRGPESTS